MSTASMAAFTADEAICTREFSRSPSKGSPRRALGALSPNILITAPNSPIVVVDGKPTTTPIGSPLKGQFGLTPAAILSMKDEYGCSPYLNARKRSFAQLDGADDEDPPIAKSPFMRQAMTRNERRVPTEGSQAAIDLSSDGESDLGPMETAVPLMPENTLNPTLEASNTQETNGSFSSLIDYDPTVASDKSHSAASSPPGTIVEEAEQLSHAQILKLRLRLAAYKVRTNQELLPFDALELIPHPPHLPFTAPAVQPPEDLPKPSLERTLNPSTSSFSAPKLLPAPVLLPTAYSSRKIEYMRSSPPASPEREEETERDVATPVAVRKVQKLVSVSGRGASPEKERGEVGEDLTSSVVKGQAASGLMELMRRG